MGTNGTAKRSFDIAFSIFALLLCAPLFLVIAVAIKCCDGGPVFYVSERIGRNGTPYRLWKFRSMVVGADSVTASLINANGCGALLFKMENDPRITPIGAFLRRHSLDELPQFFNTLTGSMSVVGPRPQVQREINEYVPEMYLRLNVRPGITGLWQVNGRSALTAEQARYWDLYYINNWSMVLDLRTIVRTVGQIITPQGAY